MLGLRAAFAAARAGGDHVDVEVDRSTRDQRGLDAALLDRLARRDTPRVALAVAVATELEPEAELAVVVEEDPLAVMAPQEAGRRQVSRETLARESDGAVLDKECVDAVAEAALDVGSSFPATRTESISRVMILSPADL